MEPGSKDEPREGSTVNACMNLYYDRIADACSDRCLRVCTRVYNAHAVDNTSFVWDVFAGSARFTLQAYDSYIQVM